MILQRVYFFAFDLLRVPRTEVSSLMRLVSRGLIQKLTIIPLKSNDLILLHLFYNMIYSVQLYLLFFWIFSKQDDVF